MLFLPVALTFSQLAAGQADPRKEARMIFRNYGMNPVFSFKAIIKMYAAGNPEKLIDKLDAEYVLQNDQYYCKMANIEIIRNGKVNFIVDHDEKVLLLGKYDRNRHNDEQEHKAFSLPSLFGRMQMDSIQYAISTKGSLRQLSITGMRDPRILKYQLIYDPSTYLVKQLLIEMKPEDNTYGKNNIVVDINYSGYDRTPKPAAFFSGKKYLQLQGEKATLSPAYKSYQLVNQL